MPNLISPEVTRLAQLKAKQAGVDLNYELARSIVEESIIELDPELDLVVNTSESFSEIAGLAKFVGANDIVVNDRHFDVRVLNDEGNVEISRALIGTSYLLNGSLIVSLQGTEGGTVVGLVTPANWVSVEQRSKDSNITLKFQPQADFELGASLSCICQKAQVDMPNTVKTLPNESELHGFIQNRDNIIAARQKQIVISILNDPSVRAKFEEAQAIARKTDRVVSDSAIWENRVENLADSVSPKFSALSPKEVRSVVRKTGEIFGGQPESPQFRRHMLSKLTVEQLSKKFAGVSLSKVAEVVDHVFSGQSALDSVKGIVNNKVAVDIAAKIKTQRNRAEGFVAATAEEIGMAFNQLALQPAYATHSSADSGIESINEALQLLEAAELAEQTCALIQ
ncbi:hypothetical protein BH10CYA1_BH10CYA1_41380 [soil metagenome]